MFGLVPVSTAGEFNAEGTDAYFVKGTLDADGVNLNKVEESILSTITDTNNPYNGEKVGDYVAFDLYIKNTAAEGKKDFLKLGTHSTVKASGDEYKTGLEASARLGILFYSGTAGLLDSPTTIRAITTSATTSKFAIWEPFADKHPVADSGNNTAMQTYALKKSSVGVSPVSVAYESSKTYYGMPKSVQTTNETEFVVEEGTEKVTYKGLADPVNLTYIGDEATNVELKPNTIYKTRVYIWLEGQDIDCIDTATAGKNITYYINFEK